MSKSTPVEPMSAKGMSFSEGSVIIMSNIMVKLKFLCNEFLIPNSSDKRGDYISWKTNIPLTNHQSPAPTDKYLSKGKTFKQDLIE